MSHYGNDSHQDDVRKDATLPENGMVKKFQKNMPHALKH
jgi:hypothetical protein